MNGMTETTQRLWRYDDVRYAAKNNKFHSKQSIVSMDN